MVIQSSMGSAGIHSGAMNSSVSQILSAGTATADTVSSYSVSEVAKNLIEKEASTSEQLAQAVQQLAGHVTGTAGTLEATDSELSQDIQASKLPPITSQLDFQKGKIAHD